MAVRTFAVPKNGGPRSLVQWKEFFFDRLAIEKAAGKAAVRALSRFGAFVRRAAQTSMRYRTKGNSAPGSPPFAHKSKRLAALKRMKRARHNGALLREFLFFAYDPGSKSVVVGPVGFKSRGGTPVPELHEKGGTVSANGRVMLVKNKPGRDARGKFVSAGERLVRLTGAIKYPPRPFMRPALDRMLPKFAACFKGTVTR